MPQADELYAVYDFTNQIFKTDKLYHHIFFLRPISEKKIEKKIKYFPNG
jgi:hypothetical protein